MTIYHGDSLQVSSCLHAKLRIRQRSVYINRYPPTIVRSMKARVLDVCCGSRMFWFDPADERAVFLDKRSESLEVSDSSNKTGKRKIIVAPDILADFKSLPFPDSSFSLVVFDPPHLVRCGKKSWLAAKYGKLPGDWRWELSEGFKEAFRVLKPDGVLIFKWNEREIPVSQVLELTPEKPLFGNRSTNKATHWITFIKSS